MLARHTLPRARGALREHTIDCLVLHLPAGDAEAIEALESVLSSASEVPVVVVADASTRAIALRAIHEGAQDYVIGAATDPDALDRSIRYAIERKRTAARLAHQALHDSLTGLPNRVLLLDRLNVAVGRSRRRPTSLALLFLDLDGFKRVNDSLGHDAGDDLLVEVARRLQRTLRPGDTVVRYGGDEFVILCEDLRGEREALRVAERARAAIAEPLLVHGHELEVRASVGVARARPGQTYARDLIREADLAMYRAKQLGSGVELFETAMTAEAMSELETEHQLRERDRARRAAPPLPADPHARRRPQAGRGRGADPLGASRTRIARADGIPAPGRGDRADRADRPMGALRSLPPAGAVASSGAGGGRRVGVGERLPPFARLSVADRRGRPCARRRAPAPGLPVARGDRGHRRRGARLGRAPSSRDSSGWGSGSASTISGPAPRR